jgi:hypothetical protein
MIRVIYALNLAQTPKQLAAQPLAQQIIILLVIITFGMPQRLVLTVLKFFT